MFGGVTSGELWIPPSSGSFITITNGQIVVREVYHRVIGHPDLSCGRTHATRGVLYISIPEAIARERRGEDVEIHLHPTPEDEANLAKFRRAERLHWADDYGSKFDGWTHR